MFKSALAGLLAAAMVLGCGGGGSDGSTAAASGSGNTSTGSTNTSGGSTSAATSIPTTVGDSYTYRRTDTSAAVGVTPSTYFTTRAYTAVNSDGSVSFAETYSNNFTGTVTNISASGATSSLSTIDTSTTTCTFAGVNAGAVAPFAVGQTWDNSWTRTCGSSVTAGTNKGSIVGIESVTVPAGTFNAYKEVYTVTTQPTSPAGSAISITNYTCWRDTALRKRVKCEWTTSTTTAGSSTQTVLSTTTFELTSYIAAASSASTPSVSRFAGSWAGSFSGSDSGTCQNITVSSSGAISGTCVSAQTGTYTITGSVDSQGNATLGTTGSGISFSGRFTSPISASGTWTAGAGESGTWSIIHK